MLNESPRKFSWLALLISALLLSSCAEHGQAARQAAADQSAALAASGYQAAESASLTLALQQWLVLGSQIQVNLAFPGSGQKLPLVVYLPGLGETAQGGNRWRQAWARAGYAVLSLQPLAIDANAWSSELARSADFKELARQHLQPAQLQARRQMLDAALAEARRRGASGDSLWSRVDFSRIALVGYDLGAQTVLAGPLLEHFRAAIALSPTVAVESTERPPHFEAGPLLLISSRRDADPSGRISSAEQRVELFDLLPAGDKYLLWFANASHASLAGSPLTAVDAAAAAPGKRKASGRDEGGDSGGHGKRRGGGGGNTGNGHSDEQSLSRSMPGAVDLETAAIIEGVSLAFLDAHLRDRPQALRWLQDRAALWMQAQADWRRR